MNIVAIVYQIADIMNLTVVYGGRLLIWKLAVQTFMKIQKEN